MRQGLNSPGFGEFHIWIQTLYGYCPLICAMGCSQVIVLYFSKLCVSYRPLGVVCKSGRARLVVARKRSIITDVNAALPL